MDADDKVGGVMIILDSFSKWNYEILTTMVSKYINLYSISVFDCNDQVNNVVHGLIMKWV